MSCGQCGSPCEGGLCRQCEIEQAHEHLANELRDDQDESDDVATDGGTNVDKEPPAAGHAGPFLHARCTGWHKTSLKRTTRIVGETATGSFKHSCHSCRRATWWNVLGVLEEVDSA